MTRLNDEDLDKMYAELDLRDIEWREKYWTNIEDGEISPNPPSPFANFHPKVNQLPNLFGRTESERALELAMHVLKKEREECEHSDVDEGICLDCGEDLREDMMAKAYDDAKDARKYGEE